MFNLNNFRLSAVKNEVLAGFVVAVSMIPEAVGFSAGRRAFSDRRVAHRLYYRAGHRAVWRQAGHGVGCGRVDSGGADEPGGAVRHGVRTVGDDFCRGYPNPDRHFPPG
ncbi:hypothetical protein D3C80_1205390 [compost metagenome]